MAAPITLELDRVRLRIDHQRGAGIVDAHWLQRGRWLPVIARSVPGEDPLAQHASFIMAPWCNRIRNALFTWKGRRIALRPDPRDGTAIHGDVRKRPFNILDRSPVSALLSLDSRDHPDFNFPWPLTLTARFQVHPAAIELQLALTNLADEPFPAGIGIHPYFPRAHPGSPRAAVIAAPCAGRFPSERCMPTGPARADALSRRLSTIAAIPPGSVMHSLTGYTNLCTVLWPTASLTMHSSPNHQHMVLFAPSSPLRAEPFFAVEPMTIAADGFNMLAAGRANHGVTVLAPGGSLTTFYRFELADR